MTIINRKYGLNAWALILLMATLICSVLLTSCEKNELKIQQNYPFEVQVMPVPKEVGNGGAVEIRITIERSGNFHDTEYFIRYFQFYPKHIVI